MSLHLVIAILLLTHLCLGSHFRGGIVTWTPTGQDLQIEVSYRISWRRSSSPSHFCNESTISSGLLNTGEGSLQCTGGCKITSIPMNYYCTDFSTTEDWTTGTRALIYNLTASSTEIFFTFTSCCWIDLATGGGTWAIKAKVNATKRTDTGRINSSPTTSVSPIVRVPYGCNTTIHILVADKDGDKVRCRWSNSSDECGDICISLPGAVLNKETCTISYHATGSVGYYGVAVQVEDFPSMGVTVPYSSVPVQFLVYVYATNLGCYSLPEFIAPTKEDQEVVYITFNTTYVDKIIAISKVPNASIAEIVTVSPSGFTKSALAEYTNVTGSWYVNITWTPTASDVDKLHILCFTATDKAGLTSKQRCINLIVLRDVTVNDTNRTEFKFGSTNNDSNLQMNDGKCKLVSSDYQFPVFRSKHSNIYVCITGIITFDEPLESPGTVNGSELKGKTILAPFFNNINYTLTPVQQVFYHVYNSLKGDINESSNVRMAQNMIQQIHGDVGNFIAQFALFVTWDRVSPTRSYQSREYMKFQLAFLTDGVNSFAFYVYPINGMNLQSQPVYIGYTTKEGVKYVDYRSFTPAALRIDKSAVSFGYSGLLHYRLSFPTMGPKSPRQTCIDWYLDERQYRNEYEEGLDQMPLCPCDTSHLTRDQFYRGSYFDQDDAMCTYILPNWNYRPKDSGKTCCYSKANGYFVVSGANAGGFVRYHPSREELKHKFYDKDMKKACCEDSDQCSLYHSVRPIGQCYTIFPAWHAPARGDPHFMTLDGKNYTFNGWGEFTLLVFNSSTKETEIQARTSRVVMKDGNLSDATAFTAFAARYGNDVKVHIELNTAKNDLIVYAKITPSSQMSDYTSDYMNMGTDFFFLESEYMTLSRRNQTKTLSAVFASGIAFNVGISVQMLNIDVLIPIKFQNLTAGLLGNFDGDASNDFRFKNGTSLLGGASEKNIFNFGMSWAVDPNRSAFWYPQGKGYDDYSHLNYTPKFLDDLDAAKVAAARDVCGVEQDECIFDLVLTQNEEIANETRRLGYAARQEDAILKNKAPTVNGPSTINVTTNNSMTYQVNAFDDGNVSYILLDGQKYANITDLKNGTAIVTLLLQEDTPYNVRVTVKDNFGVVATPHQVVMVVCSTCNNRGTCDFAEFRDDSRTTYSFKYATCRCLPYWDGPECDLDRDGCATQPCSSLRQCTDVPADLHQASGVGYNCTDCPVGYTSISDGGCEDIDECSLSNGSCSQICNNTFGSFFCSCFQGYRLQTGVCQDIDECLEASNDCNQNCSNSIGGYNCSCYEGFVFNNRTRSCDKGILPSGCNSLNCSGTAGCTIDIHGNATCFCPKGFQMSSNGHNCYDINECQLPVCQHRCENMEGSFYCSCFTGYSLQSDRSSCKECELFKYGENCNNTCNCGHGAITCDRIRGCICSDGWKGTNCDEEVDECLIPNICNDSLKVCMNTIGSYSCTCRDGYLLNTSGSCTDLDECIDPGLNTCQQICNNEVGGFSCSCLQGYVQKINNTRVCEVMYVETSLHFTLRYTGITFTVDLNNASSAIYKKTRDTIVNSLVILLGHFPGYREVNVLNIRKGSIIADAKVSVDETGNISSIHEGLKQAVSSGFIGTNMTVDSTYFVADTGNGYTILDGINITEDAYSGKLANITCMSTVVGNASPEFSWKYNGNVINPLTGSRIGISNILGEPNKPQRVHTTLSFSPIQSSDSGIYECAIKEQNLPESSKNISVYVLSQPEVSIQPITKAVYAGDIVNITCQVENNVSIYRMVWYRDGNNIITSSALPEESFHNNSATYILTRTNISSSIVYECQGENAAGKGHKRQSNISVIFNGTKICNNEIDVKGTNWSITLPGTYDIKSCPSGMSGEAARYCSHYGVWMDASYDNCISIRLQNLQKLTDNIQNGLVPNTLPESLVQLRNITSVELQKKEINVVGAILDDVIQIAGKTKNITNADIENFLSTASNVIDVKNEPSWKAIIDEGNEGASIILRNVEEYSIIKAKIISPDDEPVQRYTKSNLHVEIGYKPVSNINFTYIAVNGSTIESDSSSRLFLSKDALNKGNYTSYAGAYFRDISRILKVVHTKSTHETTTQDINSDVMSLTLVPPPDYLNPPLTITFKHLWENLSNPECSFLINNASGDGQWVWSKKGCNIVSTSDHTTVCECNHLTNFAILMSPGRTPSKDQVSLSIISTVGCAISIFCLSVTMIAHFILWRFVKSDRSSLLMNLCLALIISYVIFLAGADRIEHKNVCIAVAALLHYFYLAVFFLMLAYGIQIVITLTHVFERKLRVRWLLLIAWFLPGVIVVISLTVTKLEGYGNDKFCWLSIDDGLIWAFVGPAALAILVDFIIIIVVFRLMFSTSAIMKKTDMAKAKTVVRSLCVLLPITGITWVFGILSVNEDLVFFQYLFAIMNSLQGLFIVMFHCVFNRQLRNAIKHLSAKRKRSRMTDSSSLKSPSSISIPKHMQSFGESQLNNAQEPKYIMKDPGSTETAVSLIDGSSMQIVSKGCKEVQNIGSSETYARKTKEITQSKTQINQNKLTHDYQHSARDVLFQGPSVVDRMQ